MADTAMNYASAAGKRSSDVAAVPLSHHPMGRPLLNSIMKHLGSKLMRSGSQGSTFFYLSRAEQIVLF